MDLQNDLIGGMMFEDLPKRGYEAVDMALIDKVVTGSTAPKEGSWIVVKTEKMIVVVRRW